MPPLVSESSPIFSEFLLDFSAKCVDNTGMLSAKSISKRKPRHATGAFGQSPSLTFPPRFFKGTDADLIALSSHDRRPAHPGAVPSDAPLCRLQPKPGPVGLTTALLRPARAAANRSLIYVGRAGTEARPYVPSLPGPRSCASSPLAPGAHFMLSFSFLRRGLRWAGGSPRDRSEAPARFRRLGVPARPSSGDRFSRRAAWAIEK